eukprot:7391580-Prymnesium_polylepis.2
MARMRHGHKQRQPQTLIDLPDDMLELVRVFASWFASVHDRRVLAASCSHAIRWGVSGSELPTTRYDLLSVKLYN